MNYSSYGTEKKRAFEKDYETCKFCIYECSIYYFSILHCVVVARKLYYVA